VFFVSYSTKEDEEEANYEFKTLRIYG